ncbi:MAG TPA: ACT domain-containing protein [Asticcacaulis sp.]|jgi:acetolactate synthase-1/3 small subunit
MSHLIHIELDRLEGSLVRVIGLIERRGFHIDALELYGLGEDRRGATVTVRPRDPSRNADMLGLQIDRLYGVRRLSEAPDADKARPQAAAKQKQGV